MGLGDYAKRGWPDDDDYKKNTGGGGGGDGDSDGGLSPEERLYKFRFQVPTPEKNELRPGKSATKRTLFLDGIPCRVHEHELYQVRNKLRHQGNRYTSLCLTKNGIDERGCPLCDEMDDWARYKGFFTVIDMGQVEYQEEGKIVLHHRYWTNKDGEKQYVPFERVLLDAKAGSDDKPGVLRTLQMQAERRGDDLAGTVWDVTRGGKLSPKCGDDWDYVERIDLAEAGEYLKRFGANPGEMEDDWLKPADYMNVLRPQSYEDMAYMINGAPEGGSDGARSEGAGWGGKQEGQEGTGTGKGNGKPGEDDIPF